MTMTVVTNMHKTSFTFITLWRCHVLMHTSSSKVLPLHLYQEFNHIHYIYILPDWFNV